MGKISSTPPRRSRRRVAAATGTTPRMPAEVGENLEFALRMRGTLPETLAPDHLEILNRGLRFLVADLRAAHSKFGKNRRHGSVKALGALMRFIILFEPLAAERLDVPILVLRGALLGLDKNIGDPLLAPVGRGPGRSRSSEVRKALKGHVNADRNPHFFGGT
jgi:hypothetical protein